MSYHLYYNYEARTLCDSDGIAIARVPELRFQEQPVWEISILDSEGENYDLTGITTFRAAVDKDFQSATEVMCRTMPSDITVSGTRILVPLNACTENFLTAVNGKESLPAYFELSGFNSSGTRVLYLSFQIMTGMVLDPIDDDMIALDSLNLFAGKDYVLALLRAGNEIQFSINGATPHAQQTDTDTHYRFRNASALGTWSPWIKMIQGTSGNDLSIQYSADASAWHASCAADDLYLRFSTDGGTTWGSSLQFRTTTVSLSGRVITVGGSSVTIPEESASSYRRSYVSAGKTLADKDWAIVNTDCTLTLPAVTAGAYLKISTTGDADSVLIAPAQGETILNGETSSSEGIRMDVKNASVELFGTADGWVISNVCGGIVNMEGSMTVCALQNSSFNAADSMIYTFTLSGNTVFSFGTPSGAIRFRLYLTMPASAVTVTFPTGTVWNGGQAPDMTTGSALYRLEFEWCPVRNRWIGRTVCAPELSE